MRTMRDAFSMITAIFVMLIMATVAMLVFNLAGKVTKNTVVQYRTEQAALLARSYTELAVMAIMNHDRSTSNTCIQDIDGKINSIIPGQTPLAGVSDANGGYSVETRIYYIGNNLPCSSSRELTDSATYSATTIQSPKYNDIPGSGDTLAAVIIDVYVSYKDPGVDDPANAPNITYHRRTLQKI